MGKGKIIGYIRVSTLEQNPDRQLENIPVDRKFIDYASASSTNRPQLKMMMDFVREDDIVMVHSMDRLARNVRDLREIVDILTSRKVEVQFLKENLKFGSQESAMSNFLLSVMGAFAEFEYNYMRERQREGIEIAKKKGRYKGKKTKFTPERVEMIKKYMETTRMTKSAIAREVGISNFTLYKYLEKIQQQEKQQ